MSTYKEIKGFKVQTLSADPVVAGTSWSSGGAMNTGRYNAGSAGTQTAALGFAGYAGAPVFGTSSPPSGSTARTEAYDGSSWTEVGDLNQFRMQGISFGTQTAAIYSSGISDYAPGPPYARTTYTLTESWNGSAWTEVNNIPTILYRISAFGTSTAGITAAGAKNHPASDNSESYSWDGTNWTDGPNVNTPRSYQMGLGTSTAGMIVGGYIQSPASMVGNTEIWNGSAWTEVSDLNTARRSGGASKIGSTSEGIVFAGSTPPTVANTEIYNGSTWSETADLATARVGSPGGVGTGSSALCFGGAVPGSPDVIGLTEEFSVSTVADTNLDLGQVYYNSTANAFKVTKTILGTGAWAAGGNLNSARYLAAGTGIQTASIVAGGANPGVAIAEQYNGTAWTEVADLNQARYSLGAAGTSTAAVVFGGIFDPRGVENLTETWNGSAWTEVNELNTSRAGVGQAGHVNTSALCIAGGPPNVAITESWNGTNWAETGDIPTATYAGTGFGATNTAAIFAGGETPSRVSTAYEFGGTSWTEIAELNQVKSNTGSAGTTTDGLIYGGETPSITANAESWNGTAWTEVNNLATARGKLSTGMGRGTSALAVGGQAPSTTAATEEWTVPSSVGNQTIGSS